MLRDTGYIPARGDIIWTNFGPARGREQKGERPALVVSAQEFNKWGIAYTIPITSRQKGYPVEVPVHGEHVQGVALTSHLRAIDWRERKVRFMEHCPEDALLQVLGQVVSFLTQD